jgi:uncharacterized membrane protein YoaK (UPF0700 family)
MMAALSAWWAQHGAHVFLLGVPTLFFIVVAVRADVRTRRARREKTMGAGKRISAAALLAIVLLPGAALAAHLTICPKHPGYASAFGSAAPSDACGHCCSSGSC